MLKRSYNYLWLAVSIKCFFFSRMKGVLFIFLLRLHWWRKKCMKISYLLTSSICYKWILLKNVSVMHQCFTCFPPPHFDLRRLMKLFYPLLVWVQHIIHSSPMKGKIEPHHIWIDFHPSAFPVANVGDNESSWEPLTDEVFTLCFAFFLQTRSCCISWWYCYLW